MGELEKVIATGGPMFAFAAVILWIMAKANERHEARLEKLADTMRDELVKLDIEHRESMCKMAQNFTKATEERNATQQEMARVLGQMETLLAQLVQWTHAHVIEARGSKNDMRSSS